ncbi:MAG: DUF1294 domain-containing protein, partial [Clostridia bacterium]|nr:DUF1294 domain-containing protein [Clostridia bacterium]
VAVLICAWDKMSAIKRRRRINEMTLLGISFIGGSIAMYLTMRIIHHKTRHSKFMLGLPLMIVLQMAAVFAISKFL